MKRAAKWAWLIGATMCLAGCFTVPEPALPVQSLGVAAASQFEAKPIRVLSWNLYKGNYDGWQRDLERLAAQHDLLLLQEGYWSAESKAGYAAASGIGWWMGITFLYTHSCDFPSTGTVIGSRSAPIEPLLLQLSPYREALVGTPKSSLGGVFAVAGSAEPLLAISVHGTNLHLEQTPFNRHMDQILARVARHRGPVIVAGDFNTWSEARANYLFDRAAALGLKSVFERGPAESSRQDGRMTWSDNYLDHAFVRDLRIERGAQVLRQVRSSDHAPLSFAVSVSRR